MNQQGSERIEKSPGRSPALHSFSAEYRSPYLFVVGCPRSGTTLLQRMLNHHPELAVGYDSHFIPRAVRHFPRGVDPVLTGELVERVRQHRRFGRLGLPPDAVDRAAAESNSYSEFVSALYVEFARLRGKRLGGEKSPGYSRHLPRLSTLFPWARIIHLVRDGRDVALSLFDWGKGQPGRFSFWSEEPAGVCALWWCWKLNPGRRAGKQLGSCRYHEVRYENLVAQPEMCLRRISSFLQLSYSDQMLAYHEGKRRAESGLSAKAAWLPPTPGLRDWRKEMSPRDLELFEALAGEVLSELGYERTTYRFSPEVAEAARRCRDWWKSEMGQLENAPTGIAMDEGIEL